MRIPMPNRFRLPHWGWFFAASVILAVAAVGLSTGVPIYRQQAAIRQLERLEAQYKTEQAGPEWLRRWLGNERMKLFDNVVEVSWLTMESSDTDLRFLSDLPALRDLDFSQSDDDGNGALKPLRRLNSLVSLKAFGTQVTDAGLESLAGNLRLK